MRCRHRLLNTFKKLIAVKLTVQHSFLVKSVFDIVYGTFFSVIIKMNPNFEVFHGQLLFNLFCILQTHKERLLFDLITFFLM